MSSKIEQDEETRIRVQAISEVYKTLNKAKNAFLSSIPEMNSYSQGYVDALKRAMEIADHQSDAYLSGFDKSEDIINELLANGYSMINIHATVETIQ